MVLNAAATVPVTLRCIISRFVDVFTNTAFLQSKKFSYAHTGWDQFLKTLPFILTSSNSFWVLFVLPFLEGLINCDLFILWILHSLKKGCWSIYSREVHILIQTHCQIILIGTKWNYKIHNLTRKKLKILFSRICFWI